MQIFHILSLDGSALSRLILLKEIDFLYFYGVFFIF